MSHQTLPAAGEAVTADPPGRLPLYVHLLSVGLALQFMSGQAFNFGFPIAPDRILIPLALALFVAHGDSRRGRWRLRPIHLLFLAALLWCLCSMIASGTIATSASRFNFWDAYGVIPFLLFVVVPIAYGTTARRRTLLVALTVLGAYLGVIAVLQGLQADSLIFPRYIVDSTSTHFGRAFGPSLQVGSNGLQLFACMAGATILATQSRGLPRLFAQGVALACVLGLFFTMTRALWLGALIGCVVALSMDRRTRRLVAAVAVLVPVVVGFLLAVSPALQQLTLARLSESGSAFDRINATWTAWDVIQHHPWLGIGFDKFYLVENDWLWQLDTTPVAATGIAVHNVFLGLAVEIGIPGLVIWLMALLTATKGLWRPLPQHGEHRLWRQAAVGYGLCWLTAAMLMPISYALPSSLLWVFLGMVADPDDVGFTPEELTHDVPHELEAP